MSIWQWVKKLIVEIFWPWFKEFVWPIIKKAIEELISYIIGTVEKIKKWTSEKAKNNAENANKKADEFDKMAEFAKTHEAHEEADKFRAVAQVWREVAEQFRQENELLKREIDDISKTAKKEVSEKVDNLNIDLDFSHEKPKFMIGGNSYNLPALPYNLPALPSPNDTKRDVRLFR